MNEEQKEIMIEQPQQPKKKNKALPIILIIIIIALLAGGVVLATQVIKTEEDTKTEEKQEENNNAETNKEENEQKIVSMDEKFLGVTYTLTEADRKELLEATIVSNWSGSFAGDIFKNLISPEFKLFYTLSRYTIDNEQFYEESPYGVTTELKISTIETMAKTFFTEFTMPTNLTEEMEYRGIYNLSCDEEKCTYETSTSGLITPWRDGYRIKPEVNGNIVTLKPIYTTGALAANPTNSEELTEIDITLYDTASMQSIKEIKNYVPAHDDAQDYDNLVVNYETLETYKVEFTDDFKLVSVEKE